MEKKLDDLISKYSYMFTEMERSKKVLEKHNSLLEEYYKAKEINDKVRMDQIQKEREEVGCYYSIAFGFQCDDGWFDIIDELLGKIQEIDKEKQITIHQIKEKLGGLRVHIANATEEIYDLIQEAENKSYTTCEICGKEAKLCEANKWYKTVCKDHREIETWAGIKQIYKPAKMFIKDSEVFNSHGDVTKVVSIKFVEELDTWEVLLSCGEIVNQERLIRVPYGYIDRRID